MTSAEEADEALIELIINMQADIKAMQAAIETLQREVAADRLHGQWRADNAGPPP